MRIYVDMDGVIVDFDSFREEKQMTGEEIKKLPGAYLNMKPIPGAIEAVRFLVSKGHDVWLATKPPTGIPFAYADKVAWVLNHMPEMKRKVLLVHDKSLLRGDVLIDDRPHKANAQKFEGQLIHFRDGMRWPQILELFR